MKRSELNFNIIIPARKESKGVPKKNQLLLKYTLSEIPVEYHKKVIVSTNDKFIINQVEANYPECKIHRRSETSARDEASIKECLSEVIGDYSLNGDIVMLYLTSPQRKWGDVLSALDWFSKTGADSMLCREEIKAHPYLCMRDIGGNKGRQLVEHDLCRRQDYPQCFKIHHTVTAFKAMELQNLNRNLYNKDTVFYKLTDTLDVDTFDDLERLSGNHDG